MGILIEKEAYENKEKFNYSKTHSVTIQNNMKKKEACTIVGETRPFYSSRLLFFLLCLMIDFQKYCCFIGNEQKLQNKVTWNYFYFYIGER